jgi:hypothetical protein
MSGQSSEHIVIPSVFVSYHTGQTIHDAMEAGVQVYATIDATGDIALSAKTVR